MKPIYNITEKTLKFTCGVKCDIDIDYNDSNDGIDPSLTVTFSHALHSICLTTRKCHYSSSILDQTGYHSMKGQANHLISS